MQKYSKKDKPQNLIRVFKILERRELSGCHCSAGFPKVFRVPRVSRVSRVSRDTSFPKKTRASRFP